MRGRILRYSDTQTQTQRMILDIFIPLGSLHEQRRMRKEEAQNLQELYAQERINRRHEGKRAPGCLFPEIGCKVTESEGMI